MKLSLIETILLKTARTIFYQNQRIIIQPPLFINTFISASSIFLLTWVILSAAKSLSLYAYLGIAEMFNIGLDWCEKEVRKCFIKGLPHHPPPSPPYFYVSAYKFRPSYLFFDLAKLHTCFGLFLCLSQFKKFLQKTSLTTEMIESRHHSNNILIL